MKEPEYPSNEAERQREAEKYQLLDTTPEERYDNITALMAHLCQVPISLVAILDKDRNFLKSHHGIPFNEDPRDRSFCGHTILENDDIMIIPDATKDERFSDNPLVSEMGVRFYAGATLINSEGYRLGTLCIYDMKPRELSNFQIEALKNMAKQVMQLMECRYQNIVLKKAQEELLLRNEELEKFAAIVSHDLKSPLASINGLTEMLSLSLNGQLDEDANNCIELIKDSSATLTCYINGILNYYKTDSILRNKQQETKTEELFKELIRFFSIEKDLTINVDCEPTQISINHIAISQILLNLITNGAKYNSKPDRKIDIRLKEDTLNYHFEIEDNGDGIETNDLQKVFEIFETNQKIDREGKQGTGIGLATVKKLIDNLRGDIRIESKPEIGTTIYFSLPKV